MDNAKEIETAVFSGIDIFTDGYSYNCWNLLLQASEKVHFHTNTEMALVAEACPDIQKMIFKYNPEYFSSYLQVKNF